MTPRDHEALEYWNSRKGLATERRLNDLDDVVSDLTTFAKSREGLRTLKANRARLFEAMRKIHDIYLDTQPAEKVA